MARKIIRNWLNKFQEQFQKAILSKTSSHEIALGMAVGIFIGFLPFLGFQVLIGLVAIFLFRINKITTLLGIFVTNPITITPIFAFNYFIGKLILGAEKVSQSSNLLSIEVLLENFKPLIIGSVVVGFVVAIVAYFITFFIVKRIKKLHLKERVKKHMKKELKRFKKLQKLEKLQSAKKKMKKSKIAKKVKKELRKLKK